MGFDALLKIHWLLAGFLKFSTEDNGTRRKPTQRCKKAKVRPSSSQEERTKALFKFKNPFFRLVMRQSYINSGSLVRLLLKTNIANNANFLSGLDKFWCFLGIRIHTLPFSLLEAWYSVAVSLPFLVFYWFVLNFVVFADSILYHMDHSAFIYPELKRE